ncbi:MAG: sigma factor [Eubacteriales bacterium]|nr:sigma factor [Eubacteriales bacterium]
MVDIDELNRAKTETQTRNEFINRYDKFILKCAYKTVGKFISKDDDIYSESLIAFNNAITSYDELKGSFESYAFIVIKNHIINFLKKESRYRGDVLFSQLSNENDHGEEIAFEVKDNNSTMTDTTFEIMSLSDELKAFGLSFYDMVEQVPKNKKTIYYCTLIGEYICSDKERFKHFKSAKVLPSKEIIEKLKTNKKIIERHRKYIIMVSLIIGGEYENLMSYLYGERR